MSDNGYLNLSEEEKSGVLKRFMQEFFPFKPLLNAGFFTKEMKGDYPAQAKRVCDFFGYETVFEYGAKEIRCHVSRVKPEPNEPFVTTIQSIYD